MKWVLLDGKSVPADQVTPEACRFIGMWRPPVDPTLAINIDILCSCGRILKFRHQGPEHYRAGCFDVPQYVSLNRP